MAGKKSEGSTTVKKTKVSDPEVGIVKYFELYGAGIHKYTQAFLGNRYRDIIKTTAEWESIVKTETEGNK